MVLCCYNSLINPRAWFKAQSHPLITTYKPERVLLFHPARLNYPRGLTADPSLCPTAVSHCLSRKTGVHCTAVWQVVSSVVPCAVLFCPHATESLLQRPDTLSPLRKHPLAWGDVYHLRWEPNPGSACTKPRRSLMQNSINNPNSSCFHDSWKLFMIINAYVFQEPSGLLLFMALFQLHHKKEIICN